jgi:hypothetical protein
MNNIFKIYLSLHYKLVLYLKPGIMETQETGIENFDER